MNVQMAPRPVQTNPRGNPLPSGSSSTQQSRSQPTTPPIDPAMAARDLAIRREAEQHTEQQYRQLLRTRLSQQPEPQLTDQDFTSKIRSHSVMLLDQIQKLKTQRQRLFPAIHPNLEKSLTQLRIQCDLIFWRIFRVNDLPTEILANIFRYVAWSSSKPDVGIKYRLWLTWVCRHWRSVAIADFTLWNAIWFRELPPYEQSLTWLERAGTAPLDLRINERDEMWGNQEDNHRFTGEQMEWLLDKLLSKLSQIRMLIVIVDTWPPALVVLDKLRHAGSAAGAKISMERFELHRAGTPYVWIGPGYQPDVHRNPIPLFGGGEVPSLNYLCLNGINIDWVKSPLSNLTTIDLRRMALEVSPELSRFRDMLRSSPNLTKLALDGAGPMWEPDGAVGLRPVVLPRLRILVIGDFSLPYAIYVMANISAPYVRDLTLMNMNGEDYSPFVTTITSTFNDVRILTLYTFEVDPSPRNQGIFVTWLESMPKLGYLRVAQIKRHMLDAFLLVPQHQLDTAKASTSSPSSLRVSSPPSSPSAQILCPKLNVIEYQNVEAADVVSFGKGRKALGVPLRKIYINAPWVPSITEEEQTDLRSICDLFITASGATTPEELDLMR
jgi:hypothetical protein